MSRTYFHETKRDSGESIVAEVEIDEVGSRHLVCHVVDAWLKADEDRADAPRLTLTDAENERIEAEFAEVWEPDYD